MFKFCKIKTISLNKNFIFIKSQVSLFSRYGGRYDNSFENPSSIKAKRDKIIDVTNSNEPKLDKNMLNINIPQTNFNERLNTKENETKFLTKLTQEFYIEQLNDKNRKLWVTHDGPSFANGKPHLGLLYNKVIKDSLNRLKIMQGYKVHYNIGFDCYGVNIEDRVVALNKVN